MISFPNIHILKKKAYRKCVNGFVPETVVLPLRQDMNGECEPLVKPGDTVKEGQLVAEKIVLEKGKFNSSVYAPIPGKITGVEKCVCPDGKTSSAIRIRLSGSFSFLGKKIEPKSVQGIPRDFLLDDIARKGILNTFTSNEPRLLADDIKSALKEKTRILAVRLFDEDSSRLTDSLLSRLYRKEILEGSRICAKALSAHGIVFVSEKEPENQDGENRNPSGSEKSGIPEIFIYTNPKKYPSGYKNQIASLVRSNSQIKDELFRKISRKSLYTDSSTMLELYRAAVLGIPSIERHILVSGECLHASGLIKVAVGTTLRQLVAQCGGFVKEPGVILINGYVSGFATTNLDSPVTKYVKSVTFVPKSKVPDQRMSVCIGCGACRRVCPERLSPDMIYSRITYGADVPEVYLSSAKYCTNCALCNSCCASRLPLSQIIYGYVRKTPENETKAKPKTEERQ